MRMKMVIQVFQLHGPPHQSCPQSRTYLRRPHRVAGSAPLRLPRNPASARALPTTERGPFSPSSLLVTCLTFFILLTQKNVFLHELLGDHTDDLCKNQVWFCRFFRTLGSHICVASAVRELRGAARSRARIALATVMRTHSLFH